MTEPREASHARLERALELFLEHAEAGSGDDQRLLRDHPELHDFLEPMLSTTEGPELSGEALGDFRLVRELGRGGMGVVYEAWQRSLDRRVALKVLAPALVAEPASIARFRREAAAVARLRHPGIVEVFGFGNDDGRHWFAMEHIDGESLQQCGARLREPRAAVDLAAQVADALQHAHAMGLVHRDVKPANVIVRPDGTAVLTDFGLASDAALPSVTTDGSFLGTLDYASPEQAQGQKVDARSDVWSLGVMLFELLTGKRPFSRPTAAATLRSILTDDAPDVRTLVPGASADLAAVVARALEKRAEQRYPGAAAMLADLRALQAGAPVSARHPTTRERMVRWARREPWRATTALILLLLVPIAAGTLGYLTAIAPKIAAAEAAALARQREGVLAEAFLAIQDDDPAAALQALDRLPPDATDLEATAARAFCLDRQGDEPRAIALLEALPAGTLTDSVRAWALGKEIPTTTSQADPLDLLVQGIVLVQRARRDEDQALARRAVSMMTRAAVQFQTPRAMVLVLWMRAASAANDKATVLALEAALAQHFTASKSVTLARAGMLTELDPERALPLLLQSVRDQDASSATWFNLGLAHEKLGQTKDAAHAYRQCIARNPRHERAYNNLGMVLRKQKNEQDAAAAFRAAIAANPQYHRAWNNLGLTLRSLGEAEPARKALEQAIELRPDYAIAHFNLANLLLAGDDTQGAIEHFRRAVAADPTYVQPRANLGNALRNASRKQEALIAFALAAEIAPNDLIPTYNVAATALELNLFDLARQAADRACTLAPRRPDAHALRAQVLRAITPLDTAALDEVLTALQTLANDPDPKLATQAQEALAKIRAY